ncbi:MAG: shikimate dehydrogenase [Eggerthellaceae bacterium]|nr:shikimate dehydrogenase [Eggerthellaceae bacterium]
MAEQLYILGHPVAHSKSPAMHNAAYRALGLDWNYGFADCPTEAEARAFLAQAGWLALNITMPYKPLAFEAATWRSDAAQQAKGANVLVRCGDELLADNTDGKGCVSYLQRCGIDFDGARVVVCGTGPTSLAILHAAVRVGAEQVALLGRDVAKAARALPAGEPAFIAGSYMESPGLIAQADVVVDATPLGMRPGDPAPFDTALLRAGQTVFDVVYGHGTTALVAAARVAGCAAYDGAGMLVAQAVETVRDIVAWLDLPVDLAACDLFAIMAQAAGFDLQA